MRIDNKQAIEMISAMAVVASLIFVGYQLILDRRIAEASQHSTRSELAFELHRAWLEDDTLIALDVTQWEEQRPNWWNTDIDAYLDSGVSMEAFAKQRRWAIMTLYLHNNNFYQYQQGLLNQSTWESVLIPIRGFMSNPVSASVWLSIGGISPDFRELLIDIRSESQL